MKSIFSTLLIFFSLSAFSQILAPQSIDKKHVDNEKHSLYSQSYDDFYGDDSDFEPCSQKPKHDWLLENSTNYAEGIESAQTLLAESSSYNTRATYTIPVVFHVIHEGEAVGSGTNISDAQLLTAIDALNRDYAATSEDGGIAQSTNPDAAGNTNIQFCLASSDPSGNPTDGINRVDGTVVAGYAADGITNTNEVDIKDLSRWDNRYYLNIWVVTQIDGNGANVANEDNFGGGTLGYAYYPTNPVTNNANRDGIVALNLAVGNDLDDSEGFRLWLATMTNRTLTHEVGHYLNLIHTFEGGSCTEGDCATEGDLCCDTPPTIQNTDCANPACSGTQQVENYLDYTGENCYELFSNDQAQRMTDVLTNIRTDIHQTSNCTPPNNWDAGISAIASPAAEECGDTFDPIVTLRNYGANTLTSVDINYDIDGGTVQTFNWTGSLGSNSSEDVTLPTVTAPGGTNTFNATTVSGTLEGTNTDEETSNDGSSKSFDVILDGNEVTLTITTDNYGIDVAWRVIDDGGATVYDGGNVEIIPGGQQLQTDTDGDAYGNNVTVTQNFCIADGCYDFEIHDDFGEGICCTDGDGSYLLEDDATGTPLASGGDFAATETTNFCVPISMVPVADFTANQTSVLEGSTVTFSDLSSGGPDTWSWTVSPGTNGAEWEYVGGTSSTDQNPEIQFNSAGFYTVELIASNSEGSDTETKTDYIEVTQTVCGDPISNAYTMGFEDNEDLSQWVALNANNDVNSNDNPNTWGVGNIEDVAAITQNAHTGTNGAVYFWNDDGTTPADDWLITGCMDLEAGATYTLSYWWSTDGDYSEDLEVFIGADQTVADMNTSIQDLGTVRDDTWQEEVVTFTVPSSGEYYIGWHCTSAADQYYLVLDDINLSGVSNGISFTTEPADLTIECDEDTDPLNTGEATATTDCTPNTVDVNYIDNTSTGGCANEYVIERTWTATDDCGNSETYIQTISVEDNTAPVVTCGQTTDQLNTTSTVPLPDYASGSTFNDNCTATGDLTILQNPSAGTAMSPGTYTVTVSAEDECGNSNSCEVEVTVINDDGITITIAPNDVTIDCDETTNPTNTGGLTAQTSCGSGGLNTDFDDDSDGNTCPEIITRTWTVTDNCGNTETHVQTITVDDLTAPSADPLSEMNFECTSDIPVPNTGVVTGVSDNCAANPDVYFIDDESDGNTCPETITRTYGVEDDCGNVTELTRDFVIQDLTAPAVNNLTDINVECSEDIPSANVSTVSGINDNCGANTTVTHVDDVSDGNTCPETITRKYRVEDECGNFTEVTQAIIVNDETAPTVNCSITSETILASEEDQMPDYISSVSATDNCGGNPSISQSPAAGTSLNLGNTEVTMTATDDCGNISTCTIKVLYEDDASIKENELSAIKFYPNPTTNVLNIDFGVKVNDASIRLYDANGRLISTENTQNEKKTSVDLSSYANGMYTVVVHTSNGSTTEKVSKM